MTSNADRIVELQEPILLFDGVCNLCASCVQFVVARDPGEQFRFAFLQSPFAEHLLRPPSAGRDELQSMVLVADGQVYRKSTAALQIARRLNGLWPLLGAFLIVPRPIRDAVYDWIGRHRYQWFGRKAECWLPNPDVQRRFLDT